MRVVIKAEYSGESAYFILDDVPEDMTHDRMVEEFMSEVQLAITDAEGNDLPMEGEQE